MYQFETSNLYNNDYFDYLGNISTTENKKSTLEKDKSMTNTDHTSLLSMEEKLDNENKSSDDDGDEKDNSFDELADEEEMRVCKLPDL